MLRNASIAQHQPASHRLASAPAALGTRPVVLLPRAAGNNGSYSPEFFFNFIGTESKKNRPSMRAIGRNLSTGQLIDQPLHLFHRKRRIYFNCGTTGGFYGNAVPDPFNVQASVFRFEIIENLSQ